MPAASPPGPVRRPVTIAGTGSFLPPKVVTNEDLAKTVETSDDWIVQRTGIRARRVVSDGLTNSDLACAAAKRALEAADLSPSELDLLIVATITPDNIFPSASCWLQHKLGATRAGAMDVSAACTGFIYALATGWGFVSSGIYDRVLVVGSEVMSSITDWTDRTTCILFGDGAGAVVLRPGRLGEGEILRVKLAAEGGHEDVMSVPGGGSRVPASHESVETRQHFMRLKGREVFKFAVQTFRDLVADAAFETGHSLDDIGLVIPHQVNLRIIEAALKHLDIPPEKVFVNIDRYGNTSAASIPIALDEAVRAGRIQPGELCVMAAFGAGLTWGSAAIRW
ncbi:MAG: ketoacyl-ACP synthase III [Planctomycetales bacterium]|nr:ketoacyl-ACP synthase III [Planctomycetales bacterium]